MSDWQQEQQRRESDLKEAREIFGRYSREQLRTMLTGALSQWCEANPTESTFWLNGPCLYLARTIGEQLGRPVDPRWKEIPGERADADELAAFGEIMWSFARAGHLIPQRFDQKSCQVYWRLTAKGRAFFTSHEDHPLSLGFLARLQQRCGPGLPEAVLEHMADASSCIAAELYRPAVVMMGLAFEAAVVELGNNLIARGLVDQRKFDSARKAVERLDLLEKAHQQLVANNSQLRWALKFAHDLRERRNDAGHTHARYNFDDSTEIDELLVSAGRALPVLWEKLYRAPT